MENEQKPNVSNEEQRACDSANGAKREVETIQEEPPQCDGVQTIGEHEHKVKSDTEDVNILTENKRESEKIPHDEEEVDHQIDVHDVDTNLITTQSVDVPCGTEKIATVLLIDSTLESRTVESNDVGETDIGSSQTICDGEAQLEGVYGTEAITTDGNIPMECELESSPDKIACYVDSEVSENEPITYDLNSSPLHTERSRKEQSLSVSSTDREIDSDKPHEIFELTDDDEEEENTDANDHRNRSNKFNQSNEFDDDVESDTFDHSSEDDAQSMSDEEPIDDDYDSEERIHSIDDSDDDETSEARGVRSIYLY